MNIHFVSPINKLGYGRVGLNLLKELSKSDDNVALFPIGPIEVEPQEISLVQEAISNASLFDYSAPAIRLFHQHSMDLFPGDGLKIGFPIFELNKFNNVEKHHLTGLDHIFVCSKWAKQVLYDNDLCPERATVVPLGVNTDIFHYQLHHYSKVRPDHTAFFTIGKWEKRKGHDVLIECFNKAFTESDSVSLNLICDNPFLNQQQLNYWFSLINNSALRSKIKVLPRVNTQAELATYVNSFDCGVFISRAEGWNLELLEAMACGKVVIATNYSGHTEFVDENNALLVNPESLEMANDGVWFNGKVGEWMQITKNNIDQIIEHMRAVHKFKMEKGMVVNNHGISTGLKFSWKNSAKSILTFLEKTL